VRLSLTDVHHLIAEAFGVDLVEADTGERRLGEAEAEGFVEGVDVALGLRAEDILPPEVAAPVAAATAEVPAGAAVAVSAAVAVGAEVPVVAEVVVAAQVAVRPQSNGQVAPACALHPYQMDHGSGKNVCLFTFLSPCLSVS